MPIIVEQYPLYAPMIFTLYGTSTCTTAGAYGSRRCAKRR
jgi:hypothetical protein